MTWDAIIAGALIAALPAFVAGLLIRKKTKADTTDVITQAAERVVKQLTQALDQAQDTAERLAGEVDALKAEIARLRSLVVQLGGDPSIGRRHAHHEEILPPGS